MRISVPRTDSPLAVLIAADWYADHGNQIAEAWLRSEGGTPPRVTTTDGAGEWSGAGDGAGSGAGYGDGYGSGSGYGDGDGSGSGAGYGSGSGSGSGSGAGYGDGSGSGSGYGDGYGAGAGYGSGSGSGSGAGYGAGDGAGSGYGDGYGAGDEEEITTTTNWRETFMPNIGQFVIVRSRDQGCVCGEYQGHVGREVTLTNARQIFRWSGNRLTLFDVATTPGELRISATVTDPAGVTLLEACGIVPVTPEVEQCLRTAPVG